MPDATAVLADVVVVGGGPAGAAAAIVLARAGRDVVLVDKARFPRDKICGDGLTTGALRLLDQLGLDPGAVPSWQVVEDIVVVVVIARVLEGIETSFAQRSTGIRISSVDVEGVEGIGVIDFLGAADARPAVSASSSSAHAMATSSVRRLRRLRALSAKRTVRP